MSELMSRISADPRHKVIHQISEHHRPERRFPSWSMRSFHRRDFVGMEALLTEHLSFMKQLQQTQTETESLVWRMIGKLSEMQHRLIDA